MRLDHALDAFLSSRRRGDGTARVAARPETINNYRCDIQYFLDFLKQRYSIAHWNEIRRTHVSEFVDWIRQDTGWGVESQHKRLRSLRALFKWIDNDDDCQEMGMRGFRKQLGVIPKPKARIHVPSKDDLRKFAAAFPRHTRSGLRNYTIVMMFAGTGMRSGELRFLQMKHVERLDENIILIPEAGKTGWRTVAVTDDVITDLRRWLRMRETFAKCDRVFVTDEGNAMPSKYSLPTIFSQARAKSGVKGITPHTLRHYFCTEWCRRDGHLEKLAQMTGHRQLETLRIYVHLANDKSVLDELQRVSPQRDIRPDRRTGRPRTQIKPNKEKQS